MGHIYLLSFPNGKHYVGQTQRTLKNRLAQHKNNVQQRRKNVLLYNAWRKYGMPDATSLEECADTQLNDRERFWVQVYASVEPGGYNLTSGGDSTVGIRSAESRERTSKALRGKPRQVSTAVKAAAAQRLAGVIHLTQTAEVRAKAVLTRRATLFSRHITKRCLMCNTTFTIRPSAVSKRYCSWTCRSSDPTYLLKLRGSRKVK